MEPLVYNNAILSKHSMFAYCASTLNAISERDYPGKNYFDPRIECLDIDSYEKSVCHGEADCTTDAVIGVSNCINKKLGAHRLLLVELRLKYKSANGLSKTEWESKVSHTKDLLGSEITMDRRNIFVFTETVAPQARNWLGKRKQEGGILRNCVVYSVKEFCNNIKSLDDMPYLPLYNPAEVRNDLKGFVEEEQWKLLFNKVTYWLKTAESLRYNNIFEYESLSNTIKEWWKSFRIQYPIMKDEDDELDAQIINDDVMTVLY